MVQQNDRPQNGNHTTKWLPKSHMQEIMSMGEIDPFFLIVRG